MRRLALAFSTSGVLLLATWVQAPAAPVRDASVPSATDVASAEQSAQAVAPVARQIDAEADRLGQRLSVRVAAPTPARDPFRFAVSERRVPTGSEPFSTGSVEKGSDPVALNALVPAVVVVPVLIGVTEDVVGGVVVRTAALTMGDDMAVVKIGQMFSRFLVESISATSAVLVDVTSPSRAVSLVSIR